MSERAGQASVDDDGWCAGAATVTLRRRRRFSNRKGNPDSDAGYGLGDVGYGD